MPTSTDLVGTITPPPAAVSLNTSLDNIILRAFKIFLTIIGIVSVAFIMYGGFKMITAAGDSNKFQEGQKTLLYAVIGLVVAIIAYPLGNLIVRMLTGKGLSQSVTP